MTDAPWFDPELEVPMRAARALPTLPLGDIAGRREQSHERFRTNWSAWPAPAGVTARDVAVPTHDGATIPARWYSQADAQKGPAAVFYHGGGLILGSVKLFEPVILAYVAASGVPMLAVDYRLAPEWPHPHPAEDAYAGLLWLEQHATELAVDRDRICVMGESAGGCLAAAVALIARDRGGPAISRQILVYPMLDDRNTTSDPRLEGVATWTVVDNQTAWTALLGAGAGGESTPYHAAPARAASLAGLPPAYIEVGDLDIFLAEDIEYARRSAASGVSVELHVHPGAPHGFDTFAFDAKITKRTMADRIRVLRSV